MRGPEPPVRAAAVVRAQAQADPVQAGLAAQVQPVEPEQAAPVAELVVPAVAEAAPAAAAEEVVAAVVGAASKPSTFIRLS